MHSNWETNFFRGIALDMWRAVVTPAWTVPEVDFFERAFHLQPGARLLDVPCGNGRHSIELARRGYRMTGIDLSEEFIAEARTSPLPVEWILGDMRHIDFNGQFDGGFCFGNSFGYLDGEEARQFLASIARALKPGARFAIETGMAAESILPTLEQKHWYQIGDIYMLSQNQYHPAESRLDIEYTFIRGSEIVTRPSASYVFTVAELCRMHTAAGLKPVELLSSASGEPYQLGKQRLILVSARDS
ncbi:MAG: class I SAM-dependent methyltransferase [Terriglobia bacterium]|nr:MAG: class I SAM-dependent methyltransferase [Terriglobia bacterium]